MMISLRAVSLVTTCLLLVAASYGEEISSPFFVVIDGGSTGSRLHVFEFKKEENGRQFCIRSGSTRVNSPLSAFAPTEGDSSADPVAIADHILPLFEYAADIIPEVYHNSTIALYQATAGMRLLTDQQQKSVYDAMYLGLMNSESFVFRGMQRENIATLSGDLEGFYGALAANYLAGVIDANLHFIADDSGDSPEHQVINLQHPIGALDMGGSSTQIVYLIDQVNNGSHICALHDMEDTVPQTCSLADFQDNFFSTSHLAYGVDNFRERLWETLRYDHLQLLTSDSCDTKIIEYPCGFKGHQIEWDGYSLIGTGDADECGRQIRRLLPHPKDVVDDHEVQADKKVVGGQEHPNVSGQFFAMSLYFFTLDSLRVLSAHEDLNLNWPRPSINELSSALRGLCSRHWKGDLEDIQDYAHEFTRAEVLPHRCFESTYIVSLLKDGFGFDGNSRQITFTYLIEGDEVEWSLGMALSLYSVRQKEHYVGDDQQDGSCSTEASDGNATEHRSAQVISDQPPDHIASLLATAEATS